MAHKKAESQSALGKIWVFTVHASKKIKATVEPRCWGWHTPASEGTRKAEAGGAGPQGYPQLHNESQASLGYKRLRLKQSKAKSKQKQLIPKYDST